MFVKAKAHNRLSRANTIESWCFFLNTLQSQDSRHVLIGEEMSGVIDSSLIGTGIRMYIDTDIVLHIEDIANHTR